MIQSIPGTKDLLSPEISLWQYIERTARDLFKKFNYEEIRTPLLESTGLFVRSIGEETGVVKKEMYTFDDKGGDSVTLRPEGTASVVRSYIQNSLQTQDPTTKLYYIGPMFRYERPQKGRLRQFHQIGCELIGPSSPFADVEVIQMLDQYIRQLGITDFNLELNSLGCLNQDCRPQYLQQVQNYFKKNHDQYCEDCQRRSTTNPLRVFDCKNQACTQISNKAPVIFDHLCSECQTHFKSIEQGLKKLNVTYQINPRIARGLDYYDKTAFELTSKKLGAKDAFAGGGRYSGLVKDLGGPNIPGIGYAIGMERLILLLEDQKIKSEDKKIYVAFLGEEAQKKAIEITSDLRKAGLVCDMDYETKSLKSQLRRATKLEFTHAIILGEDEVKNNKAQVKDFAAKEQKEVAIPDLKQSFCKNSI